MHWKRSLVVTATVLALLLLAGVSLFLSDEEGRLSDGTPTGAPSATTELDPSTAQAGPSSEPATQTSPQKPAASASPTGDTAEPLEPVSPASTSEPSTEQAALPDSPAGETETPQAVEPTPTTAPPQPTPTDVGLECCQCTALGRDQHVPFRPEPGYTCAELCMRGCLQRRSESVCRLGGVGGYAVACPESP